MSNNEQEKIVEDGPQMRSVMMASPMSVPMPSPFSVVPKPSPLVDPIPQKSLIEIEKTRESIWNVVSAPPLPSMYFLERTKVYVPGTPVGEIAFRVADCLRKESIAATFNDLEAKVEAESRDHVQFVVHLWDHENQIVVEAQRISGCCFLFHQLSKAVLQAAKGSAVPSSRPRFALPDCVPVETEEEQKDCLKDGLDIAAGLLKQKAIDSHAMALESLDQITKACKCNGYAAEAILSNSDILSTLLSLIEASRMGGYSSEGSLNELEEQHTSLMRRSALNILANCLNSLKTHGKVQQILGQQDSLLSDNLVVALVEQVSSAEEQPHEACEAVRCLQTLTEESSKARRRALELGAHAAVAQAYQEGLCRHAQLQDCSGKLRTSLTGGHL